MNAVHAMMRKERLRYSVKREIDRQTVTFEDEAIELLVEYAFAHIDSAFLDDDSRGRETEAAEQTLNPVIFSLAEVNDGEVSLSACQSYLDNPSLQAFPWTSPDLKHYRSTPRMPGCG